MAVYPQIVLNPDPVYLHAKTYSAQDDRRDRQETIAPGVYTPYDFRIAYVSGRTVNATPGVAYVKGRNVADQGFYRVGTVNGFNVTLNAGSPSHPRLDQIILRVMDNTHDSSGFNEARLEAVPGTETIGCSIDNRLGATNLDALGEASKNYLLLADVLVLAGSSTILSTNIRDRRAYCSQCVPASATVFMDQVFLQPVPGVLHLPGGDIDSVGEITHSAHDNKQAYYLAYLPRTISATVLRWKYVQGTTALTGTYRLAVYDSSGYKIVESSSTAFAGAANTLQNTAVAIPYTTFDPGLYYIGIGVDTGAGSCRFNGVDVTVKDTVYLTGASTWNVAFGAAAGGVGLTIHIPTYMTDMGAVTTATDLPSVPIVAFSNV